RSEGWRELPLSITYPSQFHTIIQHPKTSHYQSNKNKRKNENENKDDENEENININEDIDFDLDSDINENEKEKTINYQQLPKDLKANELPLISCDDFLLRSCENVVAISSYYFDCVLLWQLTMTNDRRNTILSDPLCVDMKKGQTQISSSSSLLSSSSALSLPLSMSTSTITSTSSLSFRTIIDLIVTKEALFATDGQKVKVSPAPSVWWEGQLQLDMKQIVQLSPITHQFVTAVSHSGELFVIGVEKRDRNFNAFF
ncbi:hypothetical protein RFI_22799, partial [Reticulomyxa filosa]